MWWSTRCRVWRPPTSPSTWSSPSTSRKALRSSTKPFLVGVNLPWVRYGGDFGANAWHPGGGLARPEVRDVARAALAEISSRGQRLVRWWLLADGRAGLRCDADGEPLGLDEYLLGDLDHSLDLLRGFGLQVMFVLLDFLWCRPVQVLNGVVLGGRRGSLTSSDRRTRLIDSVLVPLLSRYGREEIVHSWDLFNEPEWATFGLGGSVATGAVRASAMRAWLSEAAAAAHSLTTQPVTVGLASASGLRLVESVGLDYYQVHWYDSVESKHPLARPCAALGLDRPLLLGEFPTRGSRRSVPAILDTARAAGYAGALAWSALAEDDFSGWADASPALAEWAGLTWPARLDLPHG